MHAYIIQDQIDPRHFCRQIGVDLIQEREKLDLALAVGDFSPDLPAAGITGVQLNDGPLVYEDFLTHARAERALPGDGELDVVALVRAVQRAGFTGPYCVESNTPAFRSLPVVEAAERAADAALGVLRKAGVLVP